MKNGPQRTVFSIQEQIPIAPNEVHIYTVDREAVLRGENGIVLQVDRTGNGDIDEIITSHPAFGASVFEMPLLVLPPLPLPIPPSPPAPIPAQPLFTPIPFHLHPSSSPTSTSR